jgi:hypothetical protein
VKQKGTAFLENAFRFVLWAQQFHVLPSIAQIVSRWECSRATAYRYRSALADARGLTVPATIYGEGVSNPHRTGVKSDGTRACLRDRA